MSAGKLPEGMEIGAYHFWYKISKVGQKFHKTFQLNIVSSNIGNYFYYKLWGKKLVSDENVAVIIGC